MAQHPLMVYDVQEGYRRNLLPGTFVPIIITSQADIRLLALSIFSLLLRTREFQHLAHFMVFVNGPDDRTGDTSVQDRKQRFLEDLRNTRWPRPDGVQQDMPITVCRIWSRVGHSELCDMAMPWVHTRYYLLMHDDVIIRDPGWSGTCISLMSQPKVALVSAWPLLLCNCGMPGSDWGSGQGNIIRLPHLNTSFLAADKVKLGALRTHWQAHHILTDGPDGQPWERLVDAPAFLAHHKQFSVVDGDVTPGKHVKAVSQDVGAWVYYDMCRAGLTGATLSQEAVLHVSAASWDKPDAIQGRVNTHRASFVALEQEVRRHPGLWALYTKYCTPLGG